jgi:hypothetical protein
VRAVLAAAAVIVSGIIASLLYLAGSDLCAVGWSLSGVVFLMLTTILLCCAALGILAGWVVAGGK